MDLNGRTIVFPSLLPPLSWKDDYKYDPDVDLGVGESMGEVDNAILKSQKVMIEKRETAKRRITVEKRLQKYQESKRSLVLTKQKRKECLENPQTNLLFLPVSRKLIKLQRD